MLVNILFDKTPGLYEGFLAPLLVNKRQLRGAGVNLRIIHEEYEALVEGDCTIFFSNFTKQWKHAGVTGEEVTEKTIDLLEKLKHMTNKLYWFDCSDSSGSNQFRFLPYVDKFVKPYLLKEKSSYQRQYYRDRIYTDYYHTHDDINELHPSPPRVLPDDTQILKIRLGWSPALGDFGALTQPLRKLRQFLPLPFIYSAIFTEPRANRNIEVNMRFGANYNRETVAYQRKIFLERANKLSIPFSRISRKRYLDELRHSKVAVSPFGWGEVCFRDFEIMLSGCALLKPDISHLLTWPNLYIPEETYLPTKWDLADFEDRIQECLKGERWISISRTAQAVYRKYLYMKDGRLEFCMFFLNLLNGA